MFYSTAISPELVEKLNPGKRYRLTVAEVGRQEEVWGLWDGKEWALITDQQGRECSPVWPGEEFARQWKRPGLAGFYPRRMDIDDWFDRWLTMMTNSGRMVAVFPSDWDDGFITSPISLMFDVKDELASYG